jgi:hypothetical protein
MFRTSHWPTVMGFVVALGLLLPCYSFAETDWAKRQHYWDGVKSPALPSGSCDAQLKALAQQYGHPPLIAIGDSLYNGVQSLRINWWLSEWSAPVTVAIRLGLVEEQYGDRNGKRKFYVPQYPHHGDPNNLESFGFDLEHVPFEDIPLIGIPLEISELTADIEDQGKRLRYLYDEYLTPNGRAVVDNMAFSGANSIDIVDWKIGDFKKAAYRYTEKLKIVNPLELGRAADDLSSAFFFSNAYFVLNPTKNKCLDEKTVLDLVKLRKPERVIINVGANNGLWMLAFDADRLNDNPCDPSDPQLNYKKQPRCVPSIRSFTRDKLEENIKTIISKLSSVDGLNAVYINGLVQPTQVANLIPVKSADGGLCFTSDLFRTSKCVPLSVAKKQDKFVDDTNGEIKRIVENANKSGMKPAFRYVDMAQALSKYDYKRCLWSGDRDCLQRRLHSLHIGEDEGLPRGQDQYLDNRPIFVRGPAGPLSGEEFIPKVERGGLFSFDNMHLSSVGYEILAKAVQDAMKQNSDTDVRDLLPDLCNEHGEMKPGDCIGLLVHPGWSYVDKTRRSVMLLRIAGSDQQQHVNEFNALVSFARRFFGGN